MRARNVVAYKFSFSSFRALLSIVFASTMIFAWAAKAGMDWQGKVTSVDGIKTVCNPAEGYEQPVTVKMPELWRLGGENDTEDEFFGVIRDIDIDEKGNIYLLDNQLKEVKVYTEDGVFIRSVGREGEGPGEFRYPVSMFITEDRKVAVTQSLPPKIVLLTKNGQQAGYRSIPRRPDGGIYIIERADSRAGNTVLFNASQVDDLAGGKTSRQSRIVSIDSSGTLLHEYTSRKNVISLAVGQLREKTHDNIERWEIGPDGKVFICKTYDDYAITVYSKNGKIDKIITKDYPHVARSAKEMDFANRFWNHWASAVPNCKAVVEDIAKDIEHIYVRDDGSLWVLTSAGVRNLPEGTLGVFDVFNSEGHFVKTVTLRGQGDPLEDLYVFAKDRFFVVTGFLRAQMSAWGAEDLYNDTDEKMPVQWP